tara:strand:- start:1303 stop:1527 length:225 start_codon:yes stop_codon:yes gene_type:complete
MYIVYNKEHWLKFHNIETDEEIKIYYPKPFDLNDSYLVTNQCYRAGRRLKKYLDKHPCSKNPVMHLLDWSDSFD